MSWCRLNKAINEYNQERLKLLKEAKLKFLQSQLTLALKKDESKETITSLQSDITKLQKQLKP